MIRPIGPPIAQPNRRYGQPEKGRVPGSYGVFRSNYCAELNGANQVVSAGDLNDCDFGGAAPLSLSVWFKTTATANQAIFSKFSPGWRISMTGSASELCIELRNTADTNEIEGVLDYSGGPSLHDGEWHHVLLSYDGSEDINGVHVYVDGAERTLSTVWNTLSAHLVSDKDVMLGASNYDGTPWFDFTGRIDEGAIWARALSEAEALDIYGKGKCGDLARFAPLHWWRFDGDTGTTVADHGSAGDNATLIGGATIVQDAP